MIKEAQFLPWQFKKKQFFDIVKKKNYDDSGALLHCWRRHVGVTHAYSPLSTKNSRNRRLKSPWRQPLSDHVYLFNPRHCHGSLGSILGLIGGLVTLLAAKALSKS